MMMTMIDNDDVFLNLNNCPNPIAAFNNIMRQHYDNEGNPIQRRQRQTNENNEIVSSVQSTNTRTGTKKDAFTLDLLLTRRPYRIGSKEEMTRTTPPTDSNKNFDMKDFMKHYSREQQTSDPQIDKNMLTFEDLQAARGKKPKSFFIKNTREDDY
jgi:hypothetical protein